MASNDGNGQQGPPQQQSAPQQVTTSAGNNGQMTQSQVQIQQQPSPSQQIQLQQTTTTQNLHGTQQHQSNQGQTMQQVQLLPPSQAYNLQQNLQHLLNQGQLIMPSNIFNPNMNPQIQVITKPLQNQFTHMLQPGATSYAIPTSGANNSVGQYIIGNFSPTSALQLQHQQGKPGEMTKVIGAQLQQGLWPQTLFTTGGQNSFLIRGTHPEQMYIQPQMTSNATSQQFSMQQLQTATTQLPTTSIAPVTSAQVQQTIQQGNIQHGGQQQQQTQPQQHTIQHQQSVVSIKTPANLQPKPPPLQIQPNTQQQATHQIQQQHQLQPQFQVTMTQQNPQQIQIIPQATTASIIPQSISITQSQALTTTQVLQQAQQQHAQNQNQPRHLTILPHQGNPTIQNQQVQIIHQQQPQAIRPNFTTGLTVMTTQAQVSQGTTTNGLQLPQPRQKIRKSAVTRSGTGTTTILQPPRPGTTMIAIPNPQQQKQFQPAQHQQQHGQVQQMSTTLTRIPVVTTTQSVQQPQQLVQHLKTINISAIQPNLPDATITPLIPQTSQHQQTTTVQSIPQTLQVFTTQVPSPNVSITPAPPPPPAATHMTPKKDESKEPKTPEPKVETEKENGNKKLISMNGTTNGEESEEVMVKQKLPKAMVKPQVLTHVIEGFVIQEAAEPFPMPKNVDIDEPPKKKSAMSGEMGKCEMCGKVDLKAKFKKNKRFCSSHCAKSAKAAQQHAQATSTTGHGNHLDNKKGRARKWGEGIDGNLTDETNSSVGEASANEDHHMEVEEARMNPMRWGVSEVVDFVKSLPGCSEYAEDFALQEIDGQALLLLKEDHLMSAIGMKLGPALKLCARIETIRCGSVNSGGDGNSSKV